MYNNNLHLHFVGIGGVGMAGIAEVLLNLGYQVSGSDLKASPLTSHLERLGAEVQLTHQAGNIVDSVSVVIVSSAVDSVNNPELTEARRRAIPIIPRAEMLAELMRMKYGIAVAGSHGKTTTTAMVAKVLGDAGIDPTVVIGGRVLTKDSGARLGMGQFLVAEADESDGSFCLLRPAIAVVTNIDAEHLGFYGSFAALEGAFLDFMHRIPFYGVVVACFDDPVVRRLVASASRRILSYGFTPECDASAQAIEPVGLSTRFVVEARGYGRAELTLPMPGEHFVANALAAISVGLELGVTLDEAAKSLESFPGMARRSELLVDHRGIRVFDDYGHHPTEIRATLRALRAAVTGRLFVLFQPHRYTRTRDLFDEFRVAFTDADEVYIGEIYSAGEEPIPGIGSAELISSLQHQRATYIPDLHQAVEGLIPRLESGDTVVVLGAGNVTKVAHDLARQVRKL